MSRTTQSITRVSKMAFMSIAGAALAMGCSANPSDSGGSSASTNSATSGSGAGGTFNPNSYTTTNTGSTTTPTGSTGTVPISSQTGASATDIQYITGSPAYFQSSVAFFNGLGWTDWSGFAQTCLSNVSNNIPVLTAQNYPAAGTQSTIAYIQTCVRAIKGAACVAGDAASCNN